MKRRGIPTRQPSLPPGVVVAVAVDVLAATPPGVLQPFVVRDRRGVEVLNVGYVGEA
jgi:hypothetical protein